MVAPIGVVNDDMDVVAVVVLRSLGFKDNKSWDKLDMVDVLIYKFGLLLLLFRFNLTI